MITLYQLKQSVCFQDSCWMPFYIKNCILCGLQFAGLVIIYIIFFRVDGGHYKNIMNLVRGLNSNTFNYLEANLEISENLPTFDCHDEECSTILTIDFSGECLRMNQPCIFTDLATYWPATSNWRFKNDQGEWMSNLLNGTKVAMYGMPKDVPFKPHWPQDHVQDYSIPNRMYSFGGKFKDEVTYDKFLEA